MQLVTGLALLFATFYQGCSISAYHFNIVCYMLLLSLITHLLAFINIPKFLLKDGPLTATLRCAGILLTLILTWLMFRLRDIDAFPTEAGSLAILPATCFENLSGTSLINLNTTFFTTNNLTDIIFSSGTNNASYQYTHYFLPLGLISILAIIIFPFSCFNSWNDYGFWSYCFWTARIVLTLPAIAIAIVATHQYVDLRAAMEIPEWYLSEKEVLSFSQLVSLTLLASTSLGVGKALIGLSFLERANCGSRAN
jgi:hypothetical protein